MFCSNVVLPTFLDENGKIQKKMNTTKLQISFNFHISGVFKLYNFPMNIGNQGKS